VKESKRPDPVIEIYEGFRIEVYESDPGLWRVRITCANGAKIKTFPDDDEYSEIHPPNESLNAEAAIDFARKKINAGGMTCSPLAGGQGPIRS
jgi:hypothetical protein